jgi:tetratricopeptide (TPR) repeat protein
VAPADQDAASCIEPDEPAPLAGAAPGLALPAAVAEIASMDGRAAFRPPAAPSRDEVGRLLAAALARFSAKDYPTAIDLLARVVNLDQDSFAAHGNYAIVLRQAKRVAEAEAHCRRAIKLNRSYVPGYRLLAELLTERRDVAAALAAYERLTALEPNDVAAHNNAGLLLRKVGRLDEAQAAFARAGALKPDEPRIQFNLLMMRRDDSILAEAMACCHRSLDQRPDCADVLTNLAVCLQFAGRYDEAATYFERAVSLEPDHREAGFNLSLLLLMRGDYPRGWREYEHRWRLIEVTRPNFPQPQWEGEDLSGKTILLHCEQGLGDTIQCLRFVPLVAARGGRVVLRLDRSLVRLAASLPGGVVISPTRSPMPAFDVWCPLLSLPGIFGTQVDTIPAAVPYLGVRTAIAERWQRRLTALPGLKVGLVWGGSAQHINDFRRSIDLRRLSPLLDIPGVSFVSMQVGPRAVDLATLPIGKVTDLHAELSDFAETAGAVLGVDLVIAVDTAVAHLAGALATPAWIMLPFSPDWRWMLEREDSLWYPTLRLYRQPAPGDWDGVVGRIAADLRQRAMTFTPV